MISLIRNYSRSLILSGLCLLSAAASSQKVWTLEDCINYALDNNIDIKKQILTVELNKKQLLQSGLNMLPNLNANATNVWNWGQTIDQYTNTFATTTVRSNNFYLQSEMSLFNGLTKFNTVKQNQINLLASQYDLDVIKNNISLSVAGYFLDILFNTELLNIAKEQLNVTQDQVKRIQKMVDAGSSARGDLLNIQAQEASEETNEITAENTLAISKISLQQLIDLPVTRDFVVEKPELKPVEAPKEIMTSEQIFNAALEVRPEIKSADLMVQSAQKSLAIARGAITPTLSIGGSWGTGYSGAAKEVDPNVPATTLYEPIGIVKNTFDTVYGFYNQYSYRVKSFKDQWNTNDNKSFGFYLYIPIFNGWQGRTAISRAKILKDQAELNLEAQKRDLRKNIEQAYADAVAALKKYNSSVQKVDAQEESFKYSEQKFNVGLLTAYDYNNAKKDLTAAQSDLLQAKYDFIFKTTILDFYMGKPISINK
ncbi:MAG TPA: TolC family protein [Bacteroidales bacterium]|nr:TolC family protein [Bacteroidales bacterium]